MWISQVEEFPRYNGVLGGSASGAGRRRGRFGFKTEEDRKHGTVALSVRRCKTPQREDGNATKAKVADRVDVSAGEILQAFEEAPWERVH